MGEEVIKPVKARDKCSHFRCSPRGSQGSENAKMRFFEIYNPLTLRVHVCIIEQILYGLSVSTISSPLSGFAITAYAKHKSRYMGFAYLR